MLGAELLKDDLEMVDDQGRIRLHCPILKHFPYLFPLFLNDWCLIASCTTSKNRLYSDGEAIQGYSDALL